jgi:hypothetical protein
VDFSSDQFLGDRLCEIGEIASIGGVSSAIDGFDPEPAEKLHNVCLHGEASVVTGDSVLERLLAHINPEK